jgi:hypothetical protein
MAHGGWEAAVVTERRTPPETATERRRRRLPRSISQWGFRDVDWWWGEKDRFTWARCRQHRYHQRVEAKDK